jgi:hypothetical protein
METRKGAATDGGEQQRIQLCRDNALKAWVNGRHGKTKPEFGRRSTNQFHLARYSESNNLRHIASENYRLLADGLIIASTKTKSDTGSPFFRRSLRSSTKRASFFPQRPQQGKRHGKFVLIPCRLRVAFGSQRPNFSLSKAWFPREL